MQILARRVGKRKDHPNWAGIVEEVKQTMERETKPMLIEYHERITNEWDGEKPVFKARKVVNKDAIAVYVWATGGKGKDKWKWLTEGTKPHKIRPKKPGGVLAFPSGYTPRTRPGAGGQYKGPGKSSGDTVFAKEVDHPGNKPRPFPKVIARWAKPKFVKQINNAIRRGIRRA